MNEKHENWIHVYKYTIMYIAIMVTVAVALLVKGTIFS